MNWSDRCANRTGDGPVGRSFLSSVAVLMLGGMMAGGCSDGSGSSAPEQAAPAVSVPLPPTAPAASRARVSPPAEAAAVPVPPEASTQSPANKTTGKNKIKLEPILGRTTQDIRDAPTELAAGAKSVKPRVIGRGPIRVVGNTYMVIIGRSAQLKIKHAVDLYHAQTERYPKDLQEFREKVLKPNRIRLPKLPRYQEYGYDSQTHELLILEYPDRKR